ncbi:MULTISPECIES: hypothetical protein [Kitasatospora]|uniref:hypothetical protein n=1 Tax=Kitasatospora TaxID=2063 RepID=UPI0005B95970|nr:hypothetical protein [Kitasatospora sp. MBT66]
MNHRTTTEAPATAAGALGPSPYGLSDAEQDAEVNRLVEQGWQRWEIRRRFPDLDATREVE